jgi:hypothetical protein
MVNPTNGPHRVAGAFAAAVLIAVVSCSGDGGGAGPTSGLSRQATLASLTSQEAATLCDWSCIDSVPYVGALCPTLIVGDIEDCANATGTDLCALTTAAACAAFRQCMESVASP